MINNAGITPRSKATKTHTYGLYATLIASISSYDIAAVTNNQMKPDTAPIDTQRIYAASATKT